VPGVSITKTSTLGIASDAALVYHVDGEPHVGGQCINARIHPRALRVISAIR
jgi:diacylglycerol kinase family enzyme